METQRTDGIGAGALVVRTRQDLPRAFASFLPLGPVVFVSSSFDFMSALVYF